MRLAISLILIANLLSTRQLFSQATRPLPYSSQLTTDPAVGNVQGIQRYGRPLKTDPDQGEGFSYHVYPVAPSAGGVRFATPIIAQARDRLDSAGPSNRTDTQSGQVPGGDPLLQGGPDANENANSQSVTPTQSTATQFVPSSPYPPAFDWTDGIRNLGAPSAPPVDPLTGTQSAVITRAGLTTTTSQIYHQPLIQIKMRIVEVNRGDTLTVGSILEYVSDDATDSSLTSGLTANGGAENFRSVSRFVAKDLVSNASTGTGGLVNLTSEHINWLVQGLSTELNADVITAPEVVTLNGQNVEFVSGDKLPFQLGQNVIQGTNNNIQQVFYKHVGTMVSVTPRIVNWGLHGEGQGERSVQANNVLDWKKLVDAMIAIEHDAEPLFRVEMPAADDITELDSSKVSKTLRQKFADHGIELTPNAQVAALTTGNEWRIQDVSDTFLVRKQGGNLQILDAANIFVKPDGQPISSLLRSFKDNKYIPFSVQGEILLALNNYSKGNLERLLPLVELDAIDQECCKRCENWKPQDCTIDLAVVVRLSEGVPQTVNDPDTASLSVSASEGNIRAVANVVQVQSGHGVVMAGLISDLERNDLSKVPILGDLPGVGFLFRSKAVRREKTEVLIFIEACVLDSDPCVARAESANDFLLGQAYVEGNVLDNPLEVGMHRVGFGTYLPPYSHCEQLYWERFHRKIRKVRTHLDDTFEP